MVKRKPTCFISYCRDTADIDTIEYLIHHLQQSSGRMIDFLFDNDLATGTNIRSFMDLVRDCDGVILLLTPQYRQRVESRQGGVYREFSDIILRYQKEQDEANRRAGSETSSISILEQIAPPFCLLPLIFSGSFEQSCPSDISMHLCRDFSTYRAYRDNNGHLHITNQTSKRFQKHVEQLIQQIFAYHSSRSISFTCSFEDLVGRFLEHTKHEHLRGDPQFESNFEQVFVKTYAFKKVRRQASYLLIGRKGSGKSTIVHYLAHEADGKYTDVIEINVNSFELEYLYSIASTRQAHAELNSVIDQVYAFETVWTIFLYICCMRIVIDEHDKGALRSKQIGHIPTLKSFMSNMVTSDYLVAAFDHRAAFRWAYASIIARIDDSIQSARNDTAGFHYDVAHHLDHEQLLRSVLGSDCFNAFHSILHQCTRRFLISLDGFDTAFEQFRTRTQFALHELSEARKRTDYEIDWLRAFAHVVIDMKSSPKKTPLANLVDFCVTIPKERFIEIRDSERDAYVYIGKCHEIRWSAIELVILLRKRLEALSGGYSDKAKAPHMRLEDTLKEYFPYVPRETTTTVGERDYRLPIFIDVLRHTFWRPREILIYFAKIISVLSDIRKRNIDVTQFAVSKCISDTTREIIKSEFFNEFQRHCVNLRGIIELFRREKQILDKSNVEVILYGADFMIANRLEPISDFVGKVKFLYEIGFLGLEADKKIVKRLKLLHCDVFCFNTGDETFEILMHEQFSGCNFIIHPIFCEYLDLDVSKQRMTLQFDWEYLQQQEAHVVAPS